MKQFPCLAERLAYKAVAGKTPRPACGIRIRWRGHPYNLKALALSNKADRKVNRRMGAKFA